MMIFGNKRQNSLERIRFYKWHCIHIHQGLLVCTQVMEKLFSRLQRTFKFYNPWGFCQSHNVFLTVPI